MSILKDAFNNVMFSLEKKNSSELVEIEEIPKDWQNFSGTEDEWIKVELPERINSSGCIYIGKEGSIFPNHFHNVIEQLLIINQTGSVTVMTRKEQKVINFPNSYSFKIKEEHIVKFNSETIIFIIWHPKFKKGWEGNF